jgi:hypothetical protein
VNVPHYVLIQATYGTTGGLQAELLDRIGKCIFPIPEAPVTQG